MATPLTALIARIYDAALDATLWPTFLDSYAESVGAIGAALLHHDIRNPHGTITASHGVDPESERLYAAHFGRIDPWIAAANSLARLQPGIVHIGEELVPRNVLVRSEYYNDLAKPFGLTRVLSAVLRRDETTLSSVSSLRSDAHRPFGEEERALLRELLPHLQRALQIHHHVGGSTSRAIADILDALSIGVIIVRQNAEIVFANRSAEAILRRADGLLSTAAGLTAAISAQSRRIRDLIWGAAETSAGRGTASGGAALISRQPPSHPLFALVTPIRSGGAAMLDDTRAVAAVLLRDPDAPAATNVQCFRDLWHLTPAEAQIAEAMARGHHLRRIAEDRSITYQTARSHLKRILEKTETHSQSELVRILLVSGLTATISF